MAIHVELKITHDNEPKSIKEVLFTDKSWNDNPFLHEQDLRDVVNHFTDVYGRMLEANGYTQAREDRG